MKSRGRSLAQPSAALVGVRVGGWRDDLRCRTARRARPKRAGLRLVHFLPYTEKVTWILVSQRPKFRTGREELTPLERPLQLYHTAREGWSLETPLPRTDRKPRSAVC
jgi:hypothetical protein